MFLGSAARRLKLCLRQPNPLRQRLVVFTTLIVISIVISIPIFNRPRCGDLWVAEVAEVAWRAASLDVDKPPVQLPCDNDCHRLHQLFASSSWPPDRPKSVIYILIQGGPRLVNLSHSLASLDLNFNNKSNYPVVLFYEDSDSDINIVRLRTLTTSNLFIQKVHFELPSFINSSAVPEHGCRGEFTVGYRHMCRFHARVVYEQPIMSEVEFAWRLDDDSIILRPIGYDVFRFMRDNRLQYGYIFTSIEDERCACGLWKAADLFIDFEGFYLFPTFYHDVPRRQMFYNNFEISDVSFWRSAEYRKFFHFIDRIGGIYFHRWGDAPVKSIGVSLFVMKNRTHVFSDIGYRHHSYIQ